MVKLLQLHLLNPDCELPKPPQMNSPDIIRMRVAPNSQLDVALGRVMLSLDAPSVGFASPCWPFFNCLSISTNGSTDSPPHRVLDSQLVRRPRHCPRRKKAGQEGGKGTSQLSPSPCMSCRSHSRLLKNMALAFLQSNESVTACATLRIACHWICFV